MLGVRRSNPEGVEHSEQCHHAPTMPGVRKSSPGSVEHSEMAMGNLLNLLVDRRARKKWATTADALTPRCGELLIDLLHEHSLTYRGLQD